jgi:hypothetical protein
MLVNLIYFIKELYFAFNIKWKMQIANAIAKYVIKNLS